MKSLWEKKEVCCCRVFAVGPPEHPQKCDLLNALFTFLKYLTDNSPPCKPNILYYGYFDRRIYFEHFLQILDRYVQRPLSTIQNKFLSVNHRFAIFSEFMSFWNLDNSPPDWYFSNNFRASILESRPVQHTKISAQESEIKILFFLSKFSFRGHNSPPFTPTMSKQTQKDAEFFSLPEI